MEHSRHCHHHLRLSGLRVPLNRDGVRRATSVDYFQGSGVLRGSVVACHQRSAPLLSLVVPLPSGQDARTYVTGDFEHQDDCKVVAETQQV